MNNKAEVREFLMTRRARLTPDAAGIVGGINRRVAGLRRSEVASLAGLSVEYYARIERGAIDARVEWGLGPAPGGPRHALRLRREG